MELSTSVRVSSWHNHSKRIGNLLPDGEEDLLAGVLDDFDVSNLPTQMEDLEEADFFSSGGGMELDFDPLDSLSMGISEVGISNGVGGNGSYQYSFPNGVGAVAGEHPLGEHRSRTLFMRNINSNVADSELRSLFEQYGDIRTLYTTCKQRGFVIVSYYDTRVARTAMRALENKPLRRRKLRHSFFNSKGSGWMDSTSPSAPYVPCARTTLKGSSDHLALIIDEKSDCLITHPDNDDDKVVV